MAQSQIQKIAVVGNIAGGKTRLSHALAERYALPLTHVDTLQFLPGMKLRPWQETRDELAQIEKQSQWLIDGYGPLDLIEKRFLAADRVVFVDFPLWRHRWWLAKRQIGSFWQRRKELPEGCNEFQWEHTQKLFKTLSQMHRKMRPELLRIFARENLRDKVIYVRTLKEWQRIFAQGL